MTKWSGLSPGILLSNDTLAVGVTTHLNMRRTLKAHE